MRAILDGLLHVLPVLPLVLIIVAFVIVPAVRVVREKIEAGRAARQTAAFHIAGFDAHFGQINHMAPGVVHFAQGAVGGRMTIHRMEPLLGFQSNRGQPDPSHIPDGAKSVRWEAAHLWHPTAVLPHRPKCNHVAVPDAPQALSCPECSLRQPMIRYGEHRICAYCGVHLMVHETRVFWWHDHQVVAEAEALFDTGEGEDQP